MRTLIGWLAGWICGAIGWWLGGKVGLISAVMVSALTGAVGLYAGFRWFDQNLR